MHHVRFYFFFFLMILCCENGFSQSVQKGIATFPDTTIKNPSNLNLSGEWQFHYGGFLSAQEMRALKPSEKYYVKVPSNWADSNTNGKKWPVFGAGTYYLRIVLDTASLGAIRSFAFYVGDITTAYKIYVNGQLVMKLGKTSTSAAGSQPMFCPQLGTFCSNQDTLNVIMHVSNYFYPHFSGVSRSILFGREDTIRTTVLFRRAMSVFLLSIYAILFLFQLLVYLTNRKEKSHLMIALLSVFFYCNLMLNGELTIFHYFTHFSYFTGYRIWLSTLCVAPLAFGLIRNAFPNELKSWVLKASSVLYGLIFVLLFTLDLDFILEHLYMVILLTGICILYLLYVLVMAVINKRKTSVIHLISFFILLATFLKDLLFVAKPDSIGFISPFGVCLYMLIQSSLAWFKFASAHRLTNELKGQLEIANHHLEEIVSQRTMELQKSNERLEKVNKQKDFLITSITHDLKNSFNVLINFSKIMKEEPNLDTEQKSIVEMINDSARKGYRVLENILSWAKIQVTNYAEATLIENLSDLVEKNLAHFSEAIQKKELKITMRINDEWLFHCHEGQLDSILRNLISNAVKFSKHGGTVMVSNQASDHSVQIVVHDEGIGMPTEMCSTIFDITINQKRPGTSGEEGTGLGLLIVKELTESNHGHISCSSTPSTGTDFIVEFPRVNE